METCISEPEYRELLRHAGFGEQEVRLLVLSMDLAGVPFVVTPKES